MKRSLLSILSFAVALGVGFAVLRLYSEVNGFLQDINAEVAAINIDPISAPNETQTAERDWFSEIELINLTEPPIFNDSYDYSANPAVRLLFTGYFHGDEVPYKTGEKWIGLFRRDGNYFLKESKIVVQKVDADLFDTKVTVKVGGEPVFLLKGKTGLALGPISTVFDSKDHEDFAIETCGNTTSSFRIIGMFWRLCMNNAPSGIPGKGTSLILKGPASEIVLRSLQNGCNDCSWKLIWAGDLDNDSNLDLLIDVSDHYNVRQPSLFLSTQPDRVFATLQGVGC